MKGEKTGGRKKGSVNKTTRDVQAFVDKFFRKVNPMTKLEELMEAESTDVQARIMLRLLEYRYGKPTEKLEMVDKTDYAAIVARIRAKKALHEHSG